MLLPDDLIRAAVRRAGPARPLPGRTWLCPQRHAGGVALLLLVFAGATVAQGAGGKVLLTRKYRPGQSIVYVTTVRTNSKIDSNPPALKNFFPPMPADLRLSQQSTVTVSKVAPDGAADVQHRFDKFEIQTDLGALPENVRDSITQAQQEVSERMVGQTLTAHYDHDGRLVDFEGADKLFQDIDAPVREPLLQMLRMFLEQMGGQSLYPHHPVKVGEEWPQKLDAEPLKDYPFQVQGKSTLHYSGKMRYQGVKAAIVDYHFENVLTPAPEGLRKGGALPQLEAMGMRLEMHISGKGQGRILVALDDGRVLQNHSTLHQTLSALMKGKEGFVAPPEQLPRFEIQSDTEMAVEGSKP
ncbi:MAG TPA: hypothetical protein VKO18_01165 [Terriglobia bacterium]|nr:hypothetical protein [Terriglobia bacterium]